MNDVIDFTDCEHIYRDFGGSDRKIGVLYNNEVYMIKFSENHAKQTDMSTSYVNNALSEYISSHIMESTGLPTHETVLGLYNGEVVVGCKDFREHGDYNIEFADLMRIKYDSKDIKRIVMLNQIYDTLKDPQINLSKELIQKSIDRYWETFVVDSITGNFDRHIGNWGYISKNNNLILAPVYDNGSTLFPKLSEEGILSKHSSFREMMARCLVFPSPALCLTREKVGKVGYYDMLSSNYDSNCTKALIKMLPKIDMNRIDNIIDKTPFISDIRKEFYKDIIKLRKEVILDRAYEHCISKNYDKEAYNRLTNGIQYSDKLLDIQLKNILSETNIKPEQFILSNSIPSIHNDNDIDDILNMIEQDNPEPIITKEDIEHDNNNIHLGYGDKQEHAYQDIQDQEEYDLE